MKPKPPETPPTDPLLELKRELKRMSRYGDDENYRKYFDELVRIHLKVQEKDVTSR